MKTLVVFYSRAGVTKQVAGAIVRLLRCDIEEIIDTKDRNGVRGRLLAAKDALMKKPTMIKDVKNDPRDFDLVIIGTPVWVFAMSCAVRTYIMKEKDRLKRVAFFCTQGGIGSKRTFVQMQALCAKSPCALLELTEREVKKAQYQDKIIQFVDEIGK